MGTAARPYPWFGYPRETRSPSGAAAAAASPVARVCATRALATDRRERYVHRSRTSPPTARMRVVPYDEFADAINPPGATDVTDASATLFDLTGEVAVVIGATGVLGGALAEGLAAAGATVAVMGRNHERGEACVRRITDAGGRAKFFHADATQHANLVAAHQEIDAALGPPTVLVN